MMKKISTLSLIFATVISLGIFAATTVMICITYFPSSAVAHVIIKHMVPTAAFAVFPTIVLVTLLVYTVIVKNIALQSVSGAVTVPAVIAIGLYALVLWTNMDDSMLRSHDVETPSIKNMSKNVVRYRVIDDGYEYLYSWDEYKTNSDTPSDTYTVRKTMHEKEAIIPELIEYKTTYGVIEHNVTAVYYMRDDFIMTIMTMFSDVFISLANSTFVPHTPEARQSSFIEATVLRSVYIMSIAMAIVYFLVMIASLYTSHRMFQVLFLIISQGVVVLFFNLIPAQWTLRTIIALFVLGIGAVVWQWFCYQRGEGAFSVETSSDEYINDDDKEIEV